MIGNRLSPILEEIESTIIEFDANYGMKPQYGKGGFRAATKIFISAMMDQLWELQDNEKMPIEDRTNMAEQLGKDLRKLIKTYTDIDCQDFYK